MQRNDVPARVESPQALCVLRIAEHIAAGTWTDGQAAQLASEHNMTRTEVDTHAETASKALETMADAGSTLRYAQAKLVRIAEEDAHDRVPAVGLLLKSTEMVKAEPEAKTPEQQRESVRQWLMMPPPEDVQLLNECGWVRANGAQV